MKVNMNEIVNKRNILRLVMTFFLFSFIGWVWEGFYVGMDVGTFINRGFLHGSYVPIYGFGGVLILMLLSGLKDYPAKLFLASTGLCGVLEYTTSYVQEIIFHQRWWDYSDQFMNLNGRVCLANLIAFGLCGVAVVSLINPRLQKIISSISQRHMQKICNVLMIVFLLDMCLSVFFPNAGLGITY